MNALFVPTGAPYAPPFDVDEVRALPAEQRPVGRRYTIRWWDEATRQVAIDFVVHGDVGTAGAWADRAAPGDRLQIVGPTGGYAPDPDAPSHLMVGDESALPAIAAALERVPAGRPVHAVLLVDDADHRLDLDCPGALEITWVHRDVDRGDPDQLVHADRGPRPAGRGNPGVRPRRGGGDPCRAPPPPGCAGHPEGEHLDLALLAAQPHRRALARGEAGLAGGPGARPLLSIGAPARRR